MDVAQMEIDARADRDEIRRLRQRVEEQRVLTETLEGRIKGLIVANDSFGDLAKRIEELERENQEWQDRCLAMQTERDALRQRVAELELCRDVHHDRMKSATAAYRVESMKAEQRIDEQAKRAEAAEVRLGRIREALEKGNELAARNIAAGRS